MKKRFYYIDILNCLATIFVLMMHTAQLAHFGNYKDQYYMVTNIIQAICIPAVYVFFMNSGATLLDYRDHQNTREFFIRRVKRVFIPFSIWSVFYYIFDISHSAFPGPISHPHPGIRDFINAFAQNDINNIFWFFYAIISLYVVAPVFSLLIKKHKNLLLSIVIIWFIFNDGIWYIEHLLNLNINTKYIVQPLLSSSYLGYFILGYLIRINYLSKKLTNILIGLGMVMLMFTIINVLTSGRISLINNIGPFFYSVSLVLIVKKFDDKVEDKQKLRFFSKLSGASLGIYILHPLFFALFDTLVFKVNVSDWNKYMIVLNNPIHIFVLPFLTYVVLSLVLILIKRIKIIRFILP